jgi:glycosyl transferase family 25
MTVPVYIISLASAQHRRAFQEVQAQRLGFEPIWQAAVGVEDFSEEEFLQHAFRWQRPLKKTEVGCFLSHLHVWQRIAVSNGPAVVLEDDVLLGGDWFKDISELIKAADIDHICLETWGKKIIGVERVVGSLKLRKLHQNSAGAAGYVLWPSGASKLINLYQKKGMALTDAFINEMKSWNSWQMTPANVIQSNIAVNFQMPDKINGESSIAREKTLSPKVPSIKLLVKIKFRRVVGELRKGFYRLIYFRKNREIIPFKNFL